jgi:hypothetical protein
MARYLDPRNDLTFKRIFGEHPDLLIGFLNAVMPLSPEHLIKEIEYLPAEQVPDIPGKKYSIVDVKCKDKSGRIFIVEMQMLWTSDFMNRMVFNASKAYVRQLDKVKIIGDNEKTWKKLDVWEDAEKYFDWDNTHSVKYEGYLVNHTQKTAIDLADYHKKSKFSSEEGLEMAIDALPVLTETGDGSPMVLYDGLSADSTEKLAGKWCGDLLQIVDDLPEGYQLINCCFAQFWERAKYCHRTFDVNEDGYIIKDSEGNLFEGVDINLVGKRCRSYIVKIELNFAERKTRYIPVSEYTKDKEGKIKNG